MKSQQASKMLKQQKRNTSSLGIKIIVSISIVIEVVLIVVIASIIATQGPGVASTILTLIATCIPILVAVPTLLLTYLQWQRPKSPADTSLPQRDTQTPLIQNIAQPPVSLQSPSQSNTVKEAQKPVSINTSASTQKGGPTSMASTPLPSTQNARPPILISYNDADLSSAEWINWQLTNAGYSTVLRADFVPGSNRVLKMDEALRAMKHTIIVLSPEYLAENQDEWANVFRTDPTGSGLTLLPVYVRDCKAQLAKGFLGGITGIDLVGKQEDEARNLLLTGIRRSVDGIIDRPKAPPSFPGQPRT